MGDERAKPDMRNKQNVGDEQDKLGTYLKRIRN